MSHYVGVEMSDHLSSLKPKEKKRGVKDHRRRVRKLARASRRRNR